MKVCHEAIGISQKSRIPRNLLKPIMKNPKWHPMSSDSKDIGYGLPNLFGKVDVCEIPIRAKVEFEDVTW